MHVRQTLGMIGFVSQKEWLRVYVVAFESLL
jgi:hypothetical protein